MWEIYFQDGRVAWIMLELDCDECECGLDLEFDLPSS
jgi:hypothetical protein